MDPHDNQYELFWMGITHLFYVKKLSLSNSFILAPYRPFVNRFFKGLGDPYRIRTDVNGVRGRCLNHLTNGPFGAPSRTRTGDPLIKSQLLYQLS